MINNNIETVKPIIFSKKIKDKQKVIPLNIVTNSVGPTRHYPPATKEWYNSIYAYNNNSLKNLSIADKSLSGLIKSYFNFYFNKNILKHKHIAKRFRRTSLNKIFISKAELKHTNSKVIITLYTYNEEKRILDLKLKKLKGNYLTSKKINLYDLDPTLSFNNILKYLENNKVMSLLAYLDKLKSSLLNLKSSHKEESKLNDKELEISLNRLNYIITLCEKDQAVYKNLDKKFKEIVRKVYLFKQIKEIAKYMLLINLNRYKFRDGYLTKLKHLISKIYRKDIEFNIVNLKTLYLNSDIFTEAISIKLQNRDNRLLRVLRTSLHMLKLPRVVSIREKLKNFDLNLFNNNISNLYINSVIGKYNSNDDTVDKVLLDIFPNSSFSLGAKSEKITSEDIKANVFNSLKYKNIAGARLEAKGRLTRRFTASRSVFKVKWKGSIKNLDSSYKGISSVILRGHLKSNVQYSAINSKTRNGAFGLKGWISSK
jgi:hypothetical protein